MQLRTALLALLALATLSACDSTQSLTELRQTAMPADTYNATLAAGYRDFAAEKQKAYDWWDSKYFADKGLLAATNHTMLPEEPEQWDIPETQLAEYQDARRQLMGSLQTTHTTQPELAGAAVVAYDRWVVLGDAGWDAPRIEDARDHFFAALGKLKEAQTKADEAAAAAEVATPVAAVTVAPEAPPAPTAPKLPAETTSTIVYFPFNSAALDVKAKKALEHLVDYIKSAGNVSVVIHGHADRVGSESANMAISKKRAEVVGKSLEESGVAEKSIHYFAFGASDPKVETKAGVREPQNRRVEVFVE